MGIAPALDGDIFYQFKSIFFDGFRFFWIVGNESKFFDTQILEYGDAQRVVAHVRRKSQFLICFDRIVAFFLNLVGFEFIQKSDTSSLLIQIDQCSGSLIFDEFQGMTELVATVASE